MGANALYTKMQALPVPRKKERRYLRELHVWCAIVVKFGAKGGLPPFIIDDRRVPTCQATLREVAQKILTGSKAIST